MKQVKWSFLAASCLFVSSVFAQVQYPVNQPSDRFYRYLDQIDQYIGEVEGLPSFEQKAGRLDDESIRMTFQQLEDLAHLYRFRTEGGDTFARIYSQAKEFEDHISHYRDVKSFVGEAHEGKAAKKYKDLYDSEVDAYKNFLKNSDWFNKVNPLSQQFRRALSEVHFGSLESDRNFLLEELAIYFTRLQDKSYDLTNVEHGLHELRRDARRLSYFNRTINYLISSNRATCPLGQEVEVSPKAPFTEYACQVSGCLVDKLEDIDTQMGELRHQGLNYLLQGDQLSAEMNRQSNAILQKFKDSKALLHLANQIRACETAKPEGVLE